MTHTPEPIRTNGVNRNAPRTADAMEHHGPESRDREIRRFLRIANDIKQIHVVMMIVSNQLVPSFPDGAGWIASFTLVMWEVPIQRVSL